MVANLIRKYDKCQETIHDEVEWLKQSNMI